MTTLSPELRHAIERAGDEPVRIEDPETRAAYVVLRAEVYDRIKPLLQESRHEVPEGIRQSQDAFFRDLPGLLEDETLKGQWVAYHRGERVKVGRTQADVIAEINRRGLKDDEFDLFVIEPRSREVEEVTFPSSWQ